MAVHVVLLGDSIFDNGAYVEGGPDVAQQLREFLDIEEKVTLVAVDGSLTTMVAGQLANSPTTATHLVVSAGGNDIIHHAALLSQQANTFAEALEVLADARDEFAENHRRMLQGLADRGLPVAACTIYDANYDPPFGRAATTAISIFNDAITRNVHISGCDLIDLRLVCCERGDYANPIEPSVQGGAKIADAIWRYLKAEKKLPGRTRVFI
jgi:lysophospholipase L1-like esterase